MSFHLECLLFSPPDEVFAGGPADYISRVLALPNRAHPRLAVPNLRWHEHL